MSAGGGGLAEVLSLLGKATPGEWRARTEQAIVILGENAGGFCIAECPHAGDNAAAIAASVNYLRSHGPAVAELIAADKEYDEARAALNEASKSVPGMGYPKWAEQYDAAEDRFAFAENRRAAALSNIEGGRS